MTADSPQPTAAAFALHHRLADGSHFLGRADGCQVLLKDNACFPWILIVPEVPAGIEDLHQLPVETYQAVTSLIRRVSQFVSDHFRPHKLNVACIGNQVRQMHIHIVGRSEGDAAWPGTVWASSTKEPWPAEKIETIRAAARSKLSLT
jgi:diadenosine tetraphosphate (Ap4A) HIT family hydrolase